MHTTNKTIRFLIVPRKKLDITWTMLFPCLLVVALAATVTAGPNAAGLAFLKENAEKEGVISLPSGVQYKVLKKGDGNHHPTVDR